MEFKQTHKNKPKCNIYPYEGNLLRNIEPKEYFPTIALHSENECVTLNFGAKPFSFNLEAMIVVETNEIINEILSQKLNLYDVHQIVHSYLYINGYGSTLDAYERNCLMGRDEVYVRKENEKQNIEEENVKLCREKSEAMDG